MPTKIDWTDESWNPVVGCSKVSPGCINCYAERMAARQAAMGNENYCCVVWSKAIQQTENKKGWNGKTVCIESKLTEPLPWRKPRKIFVCSMSDLFHKSVPFEFIDEVFTIISACQQHTFQILTKRPEVMNEYIDGLYAGLCKFHKGEPFQWPFKNVWLGVTAENQEMADKRIPILLQTPAAKRFVSVEPMLGAIDINQDYYGGKFWGDMLDLVICGGETGPGARPMDLDWARNLRDQCDQCGIPFFFKNVGGVRKPKDGHLLDGVEHRPDFERTTT